MNNKGVKIYLDLPTPLFTEPQGEANKLATSLKEKGIAIYFEEERINTIEISGEIMLTVLSAMAQQESENISSHVKLGIQMKLKRGELIGYNGCLGYVYDKESKQISVNYEEAEIVRYIFENGLICENENSRLEGNMCVIYEVIEAKFN